MADAEITYTDALGLAHLIQFLQGQPHLLALFLAAAGRVYEKAINIPVLAINLGDAFDTFLQALCEATGRTQDLGGYEDFRPFEFRPPHRLADFPFIGVELGCVDMSVADFEGSGARLDALGGGGLVDTEAQTRDARGAFGHTQQVVDGVFGRHDEGRFADEER